eukprot:SAG31_NODE_871_length_11335_cov_4.910822_5_plen_195_part_00
MPDSKVGRHNRTRRRRTTAATQQPPSVSDVAQLNCPAAAARSLAAKHAALAERPGRCVGPSAEFRGCRCGRGLLGAARAIASRRDGAPRGVVGAALARSAEAKLRAQSTSEGATAARKGTINTQSVVARYRGRGCQRAVAVLPRWVHRLRAGTARRQLWRRWSRPPNDTETHGQVQAQRVLPCRSPRVWLDVRS